MHEFATGFCIAAFGIAVGAILRGCADDNVGKSIQEKLMASVRGAAQEMAYG